MHFELDKILLDDILFHMENQEGDFLLDSKKGIIIDLINSETPDKTDQEEGRFIRLPDWKPANGYRLMERFTAGLKNPVLREELSSALNRNRGVFRAFRDALSQYPESEKQWFSFKEQQMKNEAIIWYNSLREEWGLEPIGLEPEDNMAVVLEDFVISEQLTGNNEELTVNKEQLAESNRTFGSEQRTKIIFTAETAAGESVGEITAAINDSLLCITLFEVKPEYRGMGIGKTLLAKMLEKADAQGLDVQIDLPAESEFFARALLLEEFKPVMQRFVREVGSRK